MRLVCAWCNITLGHTGQVSDDRISHGICPLCYDQQMREIRADAEERRQKETEEFRRNTVVALRRG